MRPLDLSVPASTAGHTRADDAPRMNWSLAREVLNVVLISAGTFMIFWFGAMVWAVVLLGS